MEFLLRDEIQSYFWCKEYCKLHPLVLYYLGPDGSTQHESLWLISDGSNLDTIFLYQVQTMFVNYHKAHLPHIKKRVYFSDGCGGQYRSYKNFMDLRCHNYDFGISVEWVLLETSYCKSPCDKIGG